MFLVRAVMMPWWLAQIATGAKAFCDNPVLGSERLNRRGLHARRVDFADRMAERRRRRLRDLVDAADAAAFERDGFVCLPDFLAADRFAALQSQVLGFAGAAREMVQGDTITRRIALDPEALAALPAARALLADRRWRGLLRFVGSADAEPITYIQTILSHRHDAAPDPQTKLHADTFHATVKAWLFLTDVAADEGPFVYVPGSHRLTPERLAWERARSVGARDLDRLSARGSLRIDEAELATLGLPPPRGFAVKANTLVVADTHGFHARGPSVRPATRVEIWAYGRRNPFLPWAGLDVVGRSPIASRRAGIYWRFRDRFARWMGQPWKDVGRKRPADP